MPMLEVAKGLADLGSSIFGAINSLTEAQRNRLTRSADWLGDVADCIESVIALARSRDWPALTGKCEELGLYLKNFSAIDLTPAMAPGDDYLLRRLQEAVTARRGLLLASSVYDGGATDTALAELARAAGAFRAGRNLIRAAS